MSQKETLEQVLLDITTNRKNLAKQIAEQAEVNKQQLEVGAAQLEKFDTLIATLQVAIDSPAVLEASSIQEAANATVSPPGAPAAAEEAVAGAPA